MTEVELPVDFKRTRGTSFRPYQGSSTLTQSDSMTPEEDNR